jgi:hypothetical protein
LFQTIVADYGKIVLDAWIAIEELVPPAENDNAAIQKDDEGDSECDAQSRNASLFNHRYHKETVRLHAKRVSVLSIGFYDASVGFSDATEGGVATPSSGIDARENRKSLSPNERKSVALNRAQSAR